MLFSHLVAAEDFELLGAQPTAVPLPPFGMLDTVPGPVLARAQAWERHLIEVETGLPPDSVAGTAPRPEYDPRWRNLSERTAAKAAELIAVGTPASERTIQRLRACWRDQGLWGLVDARATRLHSPAGRADERFVATVVEVLAAQETLSTGTRPRVLRQVQRLLAERYGDGVVPVPARASFYRLVNALAAGQHTFGPATTRRSHARRPEAPFTPTMAARPGEVVQIDTTPLDVLAILDDGVTGRVELTIAVDVATRTICAAILRPAGTKAVDAALLLARMLVPEPMRPGWPQALRMSATLIPHARLMSIDARLEHAAAKPVIMPDTIVIDHGKVFVSDTFISACRTLGVSVQPARPATPTDKAVVERTFSSINTLFCQHVAGYVGANVTRRGADVEAVWTIRELADLFDEWVVACWQHRPHEGLHSPFLPGRALSPNDVYAMLVVRAGHLPVCLTGEDYVELLPVEWRKINDYGIRIDYRTYDCRELGPYRRQRSGVDVKGGLWAAGTGKTTAITQLGKNYQQLVHRDQPRPGGSLPVAYVTVPPAATPKMLAVEFARFIGLPLPSRFSQVELTNKVCDLLCTLRTNLILIDELHNLDLGTRVGAEASDQIKYLSERIPATFVLAGVDLEGNGLFAGRRGGQIASRYSLIRTNPFPYSTSDEQAAWQALVATLENALRLHAHRRGTLLRLSGYLHERTGGMIGSLSHLVREAALDAIINQTEKINQAGLASSTWTRPPNTTGPCSNSDAERAAGPGPREHPGVADRSGTRDPRAARLLSAPARRRQPRHDRLCLAAARHRSPLPARRRRCHHVDDTHRLRTCRAHRLSAHHADPGAARPPATRRSRSARPAWQRSATRRLPVLHGQQRHPRTRHPTRRQLRARLSATSTMAARPRTASAACPTRTLFRQPTAPTASAPTRRRDARHRPRTGPAAHPELVPRRRPACPATPLDRPTEPALPRPRRRPLPTQPPPRRNRHLPRNRPADHGVRHRTSCCPRSSLAAQGHRRPGLGRVRQRFELVEQLVERGVQAAPSSMITIWSRSTGVLRHG